MSKLRQKAWKKIRKKIKKRERKPNFTTIRDDNRNSGGLRHMRACKKEQERRDQ